MLLESARQDVAAYARRLVRDKLVVGTAGNISLRDADSGLVAMTPTGLPYEAMEAADIVVVDQQGRLVDGRWEPTSEWQMHLAVYERLPQWSAVVHTHSMFAAVFAAASERSRASTTRSWSPAGRG